MLDRWDARFADIGGDPAFEDWAAFRPLRLSREEDWSDWLGHVIERSRSGRFAARLFAGTPGASMRWLAERVEREVVAETYRADLVIRFRDGDWAHVEVKVGDLALAKTASTADALRRRVPGTSRGDFLLLPKYHVPIWEAEQETSGESDAEIEVLTWHDVARALRLSIGEANEESISWRVWSAAFLGAIEQQMLDFPRVFRSAGGKAYRPTGGDLARLAFLEAMEPA